MRKRILWGWEVLDPTTRRVKVIGGWLVESLYLHNKQPSLSTIFVADRDHEWTISAPFEAAPMPTRVSASDFEAPKDKIPG